MDKELEKQAWTKETHDKTPYGTVLANQVSHYLEIGGTIGNVHRDYCGMGFICEASVYYYCIIGDGYFTEHISFPNKEAFIKWLSEQSDYTMRLAWMSEDNILPFYLDNQCITQEKLLDLSAPIEVYTPSLLTKKA